MIPEFCFPDIVARVGRALPQWPHSVALVTALNLAVKLKVLPAAVLTDLEGRVFKIIVEDAGSEAVFTWRGGMFRPVFAKARADLCFSAYASAYLKLLAREEDPDTLFFQRRLKIDGDAELGLIVKNMLDGVELPYFLLTTARLSPHG
jgi:predicted lipid carrier protein YhbT